MYDHHYPDAGARVPEPVPAPGRSVAVLRALGGTFTGGSVLLTTVVCAAAASSTATGLRGPDAGSVAVHVAGMFAAIAAQSIADRRVGVGAGAASAAAIAVSLAVLLLEWWC